MSSTPVLKAAGAVSRTPMQESAFRVRQLYRAWLLECPHMVELYELPLSIERSKQQVRAEFRKHKHVEDPRVIDLLVFKGQQELEETNQFWKQKSHIMRYFYKDEPKETGFLADFYRGKNL